MAGQKYWKKVKGEWVNTLALERQQGKEKVRVIDPPKAPKPKPKTEKERPQKTQTYKGGGLAGMRRYFRGGKV